jgi:hypothetical protein
VVSRKFFIAIAFTEKLENRIQDPTVKKKK